jgi:hypothetical protein
MPRAVLIACTVAATAVATAPAHADESVALAALPQPIRLLRELSRQPPACRACSIIVVARVLWESAESETAPRRRVVLWEQAARAFAIASRSEAEPGLDATVLDEAAYAAVRAWLYALDIGEQRLEPMSTDLARRQPSPQPIPARERELLDAIALYLPRAAPTVDVVPMRFERGALLRRYGHLAEAIPDLRAVVAAKPHHERAERAALFLLDALVRSGDRRALRDELDTIRADRELANKAQLRDYVDALNANVAAGDGHAP